MTIVTDPAAASSSREALGRLLAARAADGPTDVGRDGDGRIIEVHDGGGRWRYRYDRGGELVAAEQPDGQEVRYGYDPLGRLVQVRHADGRCTRYSYDANDRLVEVVDRGQRHRVVHDRAGLVRQIVHGEDIVCCYDYDAAGRLVEARAPGVTTRLDLDERGRPGRVAQTVDGVTVAAGFDYDADGRLAALHLPGGGAIAYTWDATGRPELVAVGGRALASFGYDDPARVATVRLGNDLVERTRADPLDGRPLARVVRRGGEELLRRDYTYDPAGRVVSDGTRSHTYDEWGRLAAAQEAVTGQTWRFEYDERGSLAVSRYVGASGAPCDVHYRHAGDRLEAVEEGGRVGAVTCDDQERLTGWSGAGGGWAGEWAGEWAWRHDAAGHLVQVRRAGAVVASFVNDHKGRPVLVRAGGRTERYLYGPDDELLAVTDAAGAPVRLVVRTPLGVLAEVDGDLRTGRVHYLHHDPRGACLLVSDAAGKVVARHRYDPFGLPLDPTPTRGSGGRPMLGGRPYLAEAGLYHLGARWYCPALRRFLIPDPWTCGPDDERVVHPVFPGARQQLARAELLEDWLRRPRLRNRYAYCGNDPVNRVDPNGYWSVGAVLLSLLGAVWTLPNTLAGLVLELSCLVGEVLRWLTWAITLGRVSWETPGVDTAASGRLDAFALVFSGGWLGSIPGLLGITFGNVFFVHGRWREHPEYGGPGDVLPTAYGGRVRIPRTRSLYEHELRHTNQYGWFGPFFHVGLPLFGVYEWDVILHGYRDAWTERDARAHGEGPAASDPAPEEPRVVVRREPSGAPLPRAWVYWRAGTTAQVLRTDGAGLLCAAARPGSPDPWDYTDPFRASAGAGVEVAVSEGARPLPQSLLATPGMFVTRTLAAGPGGNATVDVPGRALELGSPHELGLWPVTRELPGDAYATAGLPQGAAAWTSADAAGNLTVPEGAPAPDPGAARPSERGLVVRGRLDARASGLRVRLLDRAGAAVPLAPPTGTQPVEEVAAILEPVQGELRSFEAELHLVDAGAAFGPVLIALVAEGPPQPIVDAYLVHLCGLQAALVDDPAAAQPGRVPGEADEVVVADVDRSPQDTLADLSAQTRVRRMVRYRIANERRPLTPGGPPLPRPRMPLWMGEVQLVGVATADLADLLRRRHDRRAPGTGSSAATPGTAPGSASLSFRWRLRLSWDGPDANSGGVSGPVVRPGQRHAYELVVSAAPATVSAVLRYDAQGRLTDAAGIPASDPAGVLPDAYQPAPAAVPFPVAGRRAPAVRAGQGRRWGRDPGARELPALVLEFQPAVTDAAGAELVRGGDAVVEVDQVRLDGRSVEAGPGGIAPVPGDPLLRVPPFRVAGENAAAGDVEEVVRALVRDHVDRHQADAHLRPLNRACWEETVLKVLRHESGHRFRQFDDRGTARRSFSRQSTTWYYGHENEMPLFGPPHGYGIGQLDFFATPPRGATDEEVWNWVENLRAAVLVVLDEKAAAAWALIGQHAPTPLDHRTRAVYQREVVRRYNGGTEFRWTGTAWGIQPPWSWRDSADHTRGPHPNLLYPNRVLGTSVVYYRSADGAANTPDGADTRFGYPPPVALEPAHFTPETAQP